MDGEIPEQRRPAMGRHAAPGEPDELPAPDETAVLPAFITGRVEPLPARVPAGTDPAPMPDSALPASERGMLIFVATLLGVGTLAVIVVLGLGGFSSTPAKAGQTPTAVPTASPGDSPSPTPSPSTTPSPTAAPTPTPAPTRTPRRSPSPTITLLGTLTDKDPAAYCAAIGAGRPAQHSDRSWYCHSIGFHPSQPFTPTDVCRWRYLDKTASAVAVDIDDPTTWKCYR